MVVDFENPIYVKISTEVYSAIGYFYYNGVYHKIGEVHVYIPTEPELLSDEVIIGREILNKFDIKISTQEKLLTIFLHK